MHHPVLPFLVFLEKGKEDLPKKQGMFIPTEPLKSMEKKGKTLKKKEFLAGKKTRNPTTKNKARFEHRAGKTSVHHHRVTLSAPRSCDFCDCDCEFPPQARNRYATSGN